MKIRFVWLVLMGVLTLGFLGSFQPLTEGGKVKEYCEYNGVTYNVGDQWTATEDGRTVRFFCQKGGVIHKEYVDNIE